MRRQSAPVAVETRERSTWLRALTDGRAYMVPSGCLWVVNRALEHPTEAVKYLTGPWARYDLTEDAFLDVLRTHLARPGRYLFKPVNDRRRRIAKDLPLAFYDYRAGRSLRS